MEKQNPILILKPFRGSGGIYQVNLLKDFSTSINKNVVYIVSCPLKHMIQIVGNTACFQATGCEN